MIKQIDVTKIKDLSLAYLAEKYPNYQKKYDMILCTDNQYDDMSSIFHDYKKQGSYRLRGIPLVTNKRPYQKPKAL